MPLTLCQSWNDCIVLPGRSDPIKWIEKHINLRYDASSAADGFVRLDPYQIRPIMAQYQPFVREVTIMAVEQTGKSTCWRFPLLHRLVEDPGPVWIIYESEEKAAEINQEQFEPLMRHIPGLELDWNRHTAQRNRYILRNGATVDFSGAGTDITSKPKRFGVADELDTWPLTEEGTRQNLRNFRKRFRTFFRLGEGCLVVVSSPSPRKGQEAGDLTHSVIGDEFSRSDAGYWTMRCARCNKLSMPSHAVHNLQWEADPPAGKEIDPEDPEPDKTAWVVRPDSLRLICPECGCEHTEDQARAINQQGAYCQRDGTENTGWPEHVGCQWGALAAPRVFSWMDVARAQMASGRSSDFHAQANFDNSWRGLPFRIRRREKAGVKTLLTHCAPLPTTEQLANVFLSADTQDNGWYWVVRGVDMHGNLYKLAHGFVRSVADLKTVWDRRYLKLRCVMGIIDEGGHGEMPKLVRELVESEKGLYSYKGGAFNQRWRHGNVPKTILASAKMYQADLLYYLYSQSEQGKGNYWFLPPQDTLDDDYLSQLSALRPSKTKRQGHRYENWETPERDTPDHYFDCEKQMLALLDVAYEELKTWRLPVPAQRRGLGIKQKRVAPALEV